jgi:pimeloyl-ACP methyl ester carboxylesterase
MTGDAGRLARPDGDILFDRAGAGPCVILLHGWTLDRRMWRAQVEALARHYTVIAVDRRGFGASSAPPGLDNEVDDVLALQEACGVARCALVGMSQGGRVALRYARLHPERLWALALQSAPLDGAAPPEDEAIPYGRYAALWQAGEREAVLKAWSDHAHMRRAHGRAEPLLQTMLQDYAGRDLMAPTPLAPRRSLVDLNAVATPTLVLTGEHDTAWLQAIGDEIARGLPRSERRVLADSGHLSNLTHPNEFNAALLDFLGRHAPAR